VQTPYPTCCATKTSRGAERRLRVAEFDENTASSLCYTSGTTGNPKGVLYSHRSSLLHAYGASLPDALGASARDCILPVVPMFHVNAWGLPYACALTGAKLVMPGPHLDGASLYDVRGGRRHHVGRRADHLARPAAIPAGQQAQAVHRQAPGDRRSAAPPAMIRAFDEQYGITVLHAWGMTEMSPLGTVNTYKHKHLSLPAAERDRIRLKQGRGIFGVELKIVDGDGSTNAARRQGLRRPDGARPVDHLGYFKSEGGNPLRDGWFPTGDVATIDADGYMQITDRSKDVIKSGGEWISSIDLENIAVAHPAVAEAAVIGAVHPKWDERPLLVVVKEARPGSRPRRADRLLRRQGRQVVDTRRCDFRRRPAPHGNRQAFQAAAARAPAGLSFFPGA
jgi:acyl-CoA synthetase (AMP-forming)/AMP-acid ligase II